MTDRISTIVADSIETKRRFFDAVSDNVERAAQMISATLKSGGKLLIFGNGGSAADAPHIAGELVNRFFKSGRRCRRLHFQRTVACALVLPTTRDSRTSLRARSKRLSARVDVCVAISTSGQSENIVVACEQARSQGIKVIGLLGRDGGRVAPLCDLAMIVSSSDTQRIQETHNLVGHILCELIEATVFPHKSR